MITIRESVKYIQNNTYNEKKLQSLIDEALDFMKQRYPDVNFENVDYIFSASFRTSRYFRNEKNEKYNKPVVCIQVRATLYLYEKKSLGMNRFKLRTGYDAQILCALVHELTHHAQDERKERSGNELDTTLNELLILKYFYPDYFTKIVSDLDKFEKAYKKVANNFAFKKI